jgi:hypothetical protein
MSCSDENMSRSPTILSWVCKMSPSQQFYWQEQTSNRPMQLIAATVHHSRFTDKNGTAIAQCNSLRIQSTTADLLTRTDHQSANATLCGYSPPQQIYWQEQTINRPMQLTKASLPQQIYWQDRQARCSFTYSVFTRYTITRISFKITSIFIKF